MANPHRANVLVTSCLKTPVDPHTKAPLASYERERVLTYTDNRDYEELEYDDSGSDFCDEDYLTNNRAQVVGLRASGNRIDLSKIFFSNEEYYSKLEELKKAHLRTMAELESMYQRKLQLKSSEPLETSAETGHRIHWSHGLRKTHSAVELRYGLSDSSDEEGDIDTSNVEKGLQFSPKEHIKNMWLDFKLAPPIRHRSSSSLQTGLKKTRGKKRSNKEKWKHRVTVPEPFHMMLREEERRKRGIKSRSEIEHENADLKRQLEELTESQRKFRASPVPAHVHLPLYEELQEKSEERRKMIRDENYLKNIQKPFSFIERERLKKEQRQQQKATSSDQEKFKQFKAKPVPKSVYAAATGEQMKEEQLYRSIKMQMRAQELLSSASMPPSMLTNRLNDRKKAKDSSAKDSTHQPKINKEIPDFDASYRRFKKHLERRKEVKPTTPCEPFELRTAHIPSHHQRILAEIEKEQSSPRALRWPFVSPEPPRTPASSLCSSLSGSTEILPTKSTSATRKRQEAVRKALEQRRKADAEEEQWREKQRQREKRLQTVVVKRAQANDPHMSLSQTQPSKLKEFRKMDLQRKKEYQQEIKEMRQRVKGRPLLLEQVAQRNAKQAAEKHFTETLQGCDLTQDFIQKSAASASMHKPSSSTDSKLSDRDDPDMGYKPVHFRKIYLDDDGVESDPYEAETPKSQEPDEEEGRSEHPSEEDCPADEQSDENYNYSDDHEEYSEDSREEEAAD